MKIILASIIFVLVSACSSAPSKDTIFNISRPELDQLKLSYYSDYFSFVGRDERGTVAFALDNNRGQDGENWQAEHFVVLYDDLSGWQALKGNGAYDNTAKALSAIPDSTHITFSGDPTSGMLILSQVNNLKLKISGINTIINNKQGISEYKLGSSEATLIWNNRTITGRVIHEYLFLPAFNRLTRKYANAFDDFHGIYAVVGNGGDFYFHSQQGDLFSKLTGHEQGFLVLDGDVILPEDISVQVKNRTQALGIYRWPISWYGTFTTQRKDYQFDITLEDKHNIANWVIGGFAMGIVTGELEVKGSVLPIYGLGELII